MKTDSNGLGTDTATLLPNAYIERRLSTLVDYHIQDT
jgi:hypothetical protein